MADKLSYKFIDIITEDSIYKSRILEKFNTGFIFSEEPYKTHVLWIKSIETNELWHSPASILAISKKESDLDYKIKTRDGVEFWIKKILNK